MIYFDLDLIFILYLFSADLKWFRGDEELTDSVTIKGEDETYSKSELTITVNRSVILTIFFAEFYICFQPRGLTSESSFILQKNAKSLSWAFPTEIEDGYDSDLAHFLVDGANVKKLSEINTWIISYSKCFNWRRIFKLLANFGCLFTICNVFG